MRFAKPNLAKMLARRDVEGLLAALYHRDGELRSAAATALGQLGEEPLCQSFQTALSGSGLAPSTGSGQALVETGDTRAIRPLLSGLKGGKVHLDDPSWDALLAWLSRLQTVKGGFHDKAYQQAVRLRVKAYLRVIMGTPRTMAVMNPHFTQEVQQHQLRQMRQHQQESLAATRNLIEFGKQHRLGLTRELKLIADKPTAKVGWFDWKESFLYRPEAPGQGYITFDFGAEKELARQALRR